MSRPNHPSVILNDRALRTPKTGVGHYVHELLRHMPRACPSLEYVPFYFTHVRGRAALERWRRPEPGRPVQGSRKPWALRRVLQGGYELYFRAVCRLRGYGVYHEPNHIPMRFGGPTVTTIHDLSVLRYPQWHPADRVKWYEAGFGRALSQTTRFIAVSEFTKREMIELLGVRPERVSVVYNGVREVFAPAGPEEYGPLLRRLGASQPFFLFVGTLEPRKNFETLLTAFARLPEARRKDYQLVVAGGVGWGEALDTNDARVREANLKLVGYVTDQELRLLYSACHSFCWPSLYEGFGLPPLECMACGRPVITSNAASLPEVVGQAALTVDPRDADALSAAMVRLMDDAALVERLSQAGPARAAQFTWRRSAQEHAAVFREVAGARLGPPASRGKGNLA